MFAEQGLKGRHPWREEVVIKDVLPLAPEDAADDVAAVMAAAAAAAKLNAGTDIDTAMPVDIVNACTLTGQDVLSATPAMAEESAAIKVPGRLSGKPRGPAMAARRSMTEKVARPGQGDGPTPANATGTAPSELGIMVRLLLHPDSSLRRCCQDGKERHEIQWYGCPTSL
jgi:hypothetical protein